MCSRVTATAALVAAVSVALAGCDRTPFPERKVDLAGPLGSDAAPA
jgi:hypothetical protein